jgi:HSP20 family protein
MANLQVSKSAVPSPNRTPDVFDSLHNEMDRLLRRFERGWPQWPGMAIVNNGASELIPSLDVHEDAKSITIEADLPGLDEKDIAVTLNNGVLTIKGERKSEREEKKENYFLSERSFGSFQRAIELPDTVDENAVEARFDKGVLKVIAQKKPEAVKAEKKIEVKKG